MLFEGMRQNGRRGQITQDTKINLAVGGMPVYEDGVLLSNPFPAPPPFAEWSLQSCFFDVIDALFQYNASIGIGPTVSARIYYLFLASCLQAYNWVTNTSLSGLHDDWNWSERYPLTSNSNVMCWMNHALMTILPTFGVTMDAQRIYEKERAYFQWDTNQQAAEFKKIQERGHWDLWQQTWSNWFANRLLDGSKEALIPPTAADLPNGVLSLDVSTTQDISSYPHPESWTPLKLQGVVKKYLTYGWGNVRSTCFTESEESSIKTAAAEAYPTDAEREAEVAALLHLTQNLTQEQKLIAELWAGGPGTVSPPGMYMMLWRLNSEAKNVSATTLFTSGLHLAISLFEGSRLTWALKRQFMEARPIQEIRLRYKDDIVTLYDGSSVKGELWIPFQAPNFVTPPFPDFPSGHSCFGKCFANVMNHWFGSSLPSLTFEQKQMKLFSPVLDNSFTSVFGSFPIAPGASEVQPSVVPSTPLTLTFTTWDEMAESSGISRQYGGIHCVSAHTGSVILANSVTEAVQQKWFS